MHPTGMHRLRSHNRGHGDIDAGRTSPTAVLRYRTHPAGGLNRVRRAATGDGTEEKQPMATSSLTIGTPVAWSGENPGIYLKERADGPWTALATFFRVVISPHGRGHAALVMLDPTGPGTAERPNFCATDNEPLARYLIDHFVARFGAFQGNPALATLPLRPAAIWRSEGDTRSTWREIVQGPGLDIALEWSGLGDTFLAAIPPAQTPTGAHDLYSVFVVAGGARIIVNGVDGGGQPLPRPMFGRPGTSAFLAFSETWIDHA